MMTKCENYAVEEVARIVGGERAGTTGARARRCGPAASIDTRSIRPGEIFFALRGEQTDGHRYVKDAFRKGASLAVVEKGRLDAAGTDPAEGILIVVESPADALIALATHHRNRFTPGVIAITGSNGKTASKEMVAAVLKRGAEVLASPGNFNNLLGIPLTLLRLEDSHRWLVLELGISIPGEMKRLSEMVRPGMALITNVHAAHVEGLGDVGNIAAEKLDIVNNLERDGTLFLNGDDPILVAKAKGRGLDFRTFGLGGENDVRPVRSEPWRREGVRLEVEGVGEITLPLHGRHQVRNALGAIALCTAAAVPMAQIREGLGAVRLPGGRFAPEEVGGVWLVDDTYNANTASTAAAVEFLVNVECRGNRVLVLGDMLELGAAEESSHRDVGIDVAAHDLDRLFLWGERCRHVAESAIEAGYPSARITLAMENKESFASEIAEFLEAGDVVVVKGSRGMRMEEICRVIRERAGDRPAKEGSI